MRQSGPVRRSSIVGTWYPAEPEALGQEVDAYLGEAVDAPFQVRALIGPHAGLMYSGAVAGRAYGSLRRDDYDVVLLVGPSHFVGFDGVSVVARGWFETPLGPAVVDEARAQRLLEVGDGVVVEYPRGHTPEHSVEMHLPFVRRVLPSTPIVPLVMGYQTRETILALARALTVVAADTRALLVASTDLSHYFDADEAARLDARVVEHVQAFDDDGLLAELERYPEGERGRYVACGGGPAVAVMRAARGIGATRSDVLVRADSSLVNGDRSQVVGYLAAVLGG